MGVYAGYKVAETPNNKSYRAAYRHFRHGACLMDYSYLQCLRVEVRAGGLPGCVRLLGVVGDYSRYY